MIKTYGEIAVMHLNCRVESVIFLALAENRTLPDELHASVHHHSISFHIDYI